MRASKKEKMRVRNVTRIFYRLIRQNEISLRAAVSFHLR